MCNIRMVVLSFFMITTTGCAKYLDSIPDSALTVPKNISDFQQLLENEKMFVNTPALGEFGTDDITISDDILSSRSLVLQNGYIYAKDVFAGVKNQDWSTAYEKIYYCNVVLEGLDKVKDSKGSSLNYNLLKGWALFCRANAFYDLQEVFGHPYQPLSSVTDLGIPLKLSSKLDQVISRSTVQVTFEQIVKDLEEAANLLPEDISLINRSKPSKAVAYALLARVYLVMQSYEKSLQSATKSLSLFNKLVDYNTLNTSLRLPFSPVIDEVIYHSLQLSYLPSNCQVASELYESFDQNDLRKELFFNLTAIPGKPVFRGYYSGSTVAFNGIATDEVFLTRAECNARLGHTQKALDDINILLVKRYRSGQFTPYTVENTNDILRLVLSERRKECILRNLRWSDLRRLNQDPRFEKTISHSSKGIVYILVPNDLKYVFPIPDEEIRTSSIQQNLR
jgi:tetratricopeptide (TPR) repeat protein